MTSRRIKLKGYRVTKTKTGKTVLEPIACYRMNASARIAQKKSTKQTVVRRTP